MSKAQNAIQEIGRQVKPTKYELIDTQKQLNELLKIYTTQHPKIIELQEKLRAQKAEITKASEPKKIFHEIKKNDERKLEFPEIPKIKFPQEIQIFLFFGLLLFLSYHIFKFFRKLDFSFTKKAPIIKRKEHVLKYIKLPVIAEISIAEIGSNNLSRIYKAKSNGFSDKVFTNKFEDFLYEISLTGANRHPITAFTSIGTGNGKAAISASVALYLSAHKYTLFVDADMQKSTLHNAFNFYRKPGFSDILLNEKDLKQSVYELIENAFYFLPAGEKTPDNRMLKEYAKMQKLNNILSQKFDHLIYNFPEIDSFENANGTLDFADNIILVVKHGTKVDDLLNAINNMGYSARSKVKIIFIKK